MDLEGAFLNLQEALLHSLPKSGGLAPLTPRFLRPCFDLLSMMHLSIKLKTEFNNNYLIRYMTATKKYINRNFN